MTATRNFLEPVHLSAGRLYLRPTEPADEPAVAAALHDPGIARWNTGISIARAPEAERAAMWLRVRDQGWASGAAANFAICDATTGTLLGTVGIRDINRLPEQALAGYWTVPEARGQGIAPQALEAVSRWAFAPVRSGGLGLHRIVLDHALINSGSCRVAEKAGFRLEGTMRGSFLAFDGTRHDSHLHARLATDSVAADA
ncbi:MAG TPA: GNAT family N-acetyltransferase [Actinospica sp.]|nr:GNAT family N-acetyltransferase [Actinospica sp.]